VSAQDIGQLFFMIIAVGGFALGWKLGRSNGADGARREVAREAQVALEHRGMDALGLKIAIELAGWDAVSGWDRRDPHGLRDVSVENAEAAAQLARIRQHAEDLGVVFGIEPIDRTLQRVLAAALRPPP
jgi:hypothetical protein